MGFEYTTKLHLPDLFQPGPTNWFLREAAHVGGDKMVDYTTENTPVKTGNLRTSWRQKPVVRAYTARGELCYESGVETDVEYGPYVEQGTGIYGPTHNEYEIVPKGKAAGGADFLRFVIDGRVIYAKHVWHPGSPGNHMVAIAANMVEARLDEILRPTLMRWKEAHERGESGVRFVLR